MCVCHRLILSGHVTLVQQLCNQQASSHDVRCAASMVLLAT